MQPALVPTIICPHCEADLEAHREFCPHCGRSVTTHPDAPQSTREIMNRPWMIALVLLHVGLLGIPLYWQLDYPRSTRLWLCIGSIAYTVLAVGLIVWIGWWLYATLFA